jgi:hypothetical protein
MGFSCDKIGLSKLYALDPLFSIGGKGFKMKYINCVICVLVLLVAVISVDITPKAYELLSSYDESGQVWISKVVYS